LYYNGLQTYMSGALGKTIATGLAGASARGRKPLAELVPGLQPAQLNDIAYLISGGAVTGPIYVTPKSWSVDATGGTLAPIAPAFLARLGQISIDNPKDPPFDPKAPDVLQS
jgi:hypothetical protein